MSDQWAEKLLEIISQEQFEEHDDERAALKLKRRLLPLLLAGQAMRKHYGKIVVAERSDSCNSWDTAKQKAMEGKWAK